MRPELDNRFLQVGPSSGPRLPREDRAGWRHIGGQDVELTFYRRRGYRIVFRTQFETSAVRLNSVVCIKPFM